MVQINCTPSITTNASSGERSNASAHTELVITLLFLALLAIPIILINCFVVCLVWKKKILRTPANICLASLACSDLLTGICAIPMVIGCTLSAAKYPSSSGARAWCLTMDLVSRLLSISAILHLLVIAVERYVVIVRHVRPDDFLSCKKYVVFVTALWFVPLCASLIQLSWLDWQGVPHLNSISQTEVTYDLVCIFGFACVPLLVIIIAYSRVFRVLRRHTRDIEKQAALFVSNSRRQRHKIKEKRAAIIYASMILFYVIAWFPYFVISLSNDLDKGDIVSKIPGWAYTMFLFIRFASPLANPILYTFFKQDFKNVIRSIRRGEFQAQIEQAPSSPPEENAVQMQTLRQCSTTAVVQK